jgi:hypothetical protein
VVLWGDRLGWLAGSAVAAALVVAIARATALDAYVRADLSGEMLRWPPVGAVSGRAVPGGTVRPVVVVGAQGGGIRAAVLGAVVVDVC